MVVWQGSIDLALLQDWLRNWSKHICFFPKWTSMFVKWTSVSVTWTCTLCKNGHVFLSLLVNLIAQPWQHWLTLSKFDFFQVSRSDHAQESMITHNAVSWRKSWTGLSFQHTCFGLNETSSCAIVFFLHIRKLIFCEKSSRKHQVQN